MPVSEAPNDARDLVRVRFISGLTDNVAGIDLVRGEAQAGCTPAVAERLCAIFGHVVEIVGPWSDPVPPPAAPCLPPEPPAEPVELAREASPPSELAVTLGSMIDQTVASVAIENTARAATAHATEIARIAGRAPRRR